VQIAQTAPQFKQAFLRNYSRLWRRHPLAFSPLHWHTYCMLKQRDKISHLIKRRYLLFLCVAVCCSVLQCVAMCCNVLQLTFGVLAPKAIRQEMTHTLSHTHKTHIHTHIHSPSHPHVQTYTHIFTHTHTQTHTHTYTNTSTLHKYKHTYTHTRTYTHMH